MRRRDVRQRYPQAGWIEQIGRDEFGLQSFPPHRDLADAIVGADASLASAAINEILDIVEGEIRTIIGIRQRAKTTGR